MKRIISLILCLAFIAGLSVSCVKAPPEEKPVEIDIGKYRIIRPSDCGRMMRDEAIKVRETILEKTGVTLEIKEDWVKDPSEIDPEAYEILIGNTNRPDSAEAVNGLDTESFSVYITEKKILIAGTNDFITVDACEYFMNECLKDASNGVLRLPENYHYRSEEYRNIDLLKDGKFLYDIVYADGLLNQPQGYKGAKEVDLPVQLSMDLLKEFKNHTNADIRLATDFTKPDTNTAELREILVGDTNRPESLEGKTKFETNEYGYCFIGNKIVITGWNEEALCRAVDMFKSRVGKSVIRDESGENAIRMTAGDAIKEKNPTWITDIPEFAAGALEGCVTCNHGQLEYFYTGVTSADFSEYKAKVAENGYDLYSENGLAGNLYATFTNAEKNTFLHVLYVKYLGAVRIIAGKNGSYPGLPRIKDEPYEKITEPKITQLTLNYGEGNFGMCYVITLEDGSFILIDGGGNTGKIDHIRLYNLLNRLNERKDKKIVIAAWFLSHSHWDHFMGFYELCMKYGRQIEIQNFIANVPDRYVSHNSYNPGPHMEDGSFDRACGAVKGGVKYIKPHTGMVFEIRNAKIEILYTTEDLYPDRLHWFNDSSMVFRMTMAGQKIMWLGDIGPDGSKVITDMYGKTLKSDIVQIAHHGYIGGTVLLYKNIDAPVTFWPCSREQFNSNTNPSNGQPFAGVDRYVAGRAGTKDIFVSGDGNYSITLPYEAGSHGARLIDVPTK